MNKTILFLISLLCGSQTQAESFSQKLATAALDRTQHKVHYDGSYLSIPYPMGDVPEKIGVCTDVVIRSFRTLSVDLQELVHIDMATNFSAYPSKRIWGLTSPDTNIDHRRVPNLKVFFSRHGQSLSISRDPESYLAGDIVTWMLPGNLPHIDIVSDRLSESQEPLIVHNIGNGPELEAMLFRYKITGHYRFPLELSAIQ